jgi:hypothetical protein
MGLNEKVVTCPCCGALLILSLELNMREKGWTMYGDATAALRIATPESPEVHVAREAD